MRRRFLATQAQVPVAVSCNYSHPRPWSYVLDSDGQSAGDGAPPKRMC